MEINVVHRYSHLGEKLLRATYNAISVKLTGPLHVFDGCTRSKAKSREVRKNTYKRASHPGEIIFVNTTGPFPDSLVGIWYWFGVEDNYNCYSWSFFTNTKSQLPKICKSFREDDVTWDASYVSPLHQGRKTLIKVTEGLKIKC